MLLPLSEERPNQAGQFLRFRMYVDLLGKALERTGKSNLSRAGQSDTILLERGLKLLAA